MSQTTTPSAASLLIDSLTPKHRAVLYNALVTAEIDYQQNLIDEANPDCTDLNKRVNLFVQWNLQTIKNIKALLFAECFPEDLQLIPHFQKEHPQTIKVVKSEKSTIAEPSESN
jgi:hypothetical protein